MAASRKTATKAAPRKSTPAGPRSRSKTARTQAAADLRDGPANAVEVPAEKPASLRTVMAPDAEATAPAAAEGAETADTGEDDPRFKRGDLIEAVAERTSLKRSDAKVVLELVLDELGRALDRNEELVLPPLGKLIVKKRKPDADGPDILTLKIRRPRTDGAEAGESPLADPDEDS